MPPRRLRLARPQKKQPQPSDSEEEEDEPEVKANPRINTKGALFLLLMFVSSLAGHYYPLLWPRSTWAFLPQPSPYPHEVLQALGSSPDEDFTAHERTSREKGDPATAVTSSSPGSTSQHRHEARLLSAEDTSGADLSEPHGVRSAGQNIEHQGRPGFMGRKQPARAGSSADEEWQSVFVHDIRIRMDKEPLCRGVIPSKYYPGNRSKRAPIRMVEDLAHSKERLLVFLPRHGLGNSLRSYVSAYVYALLSGRRLVRMHAAEHAKVYDLLCESFICGFDAVRWANESGRLPMEIYRKFGELKPFYFLEEYKKNSDIAESIHSDYPIFATRSGSHFDVYWHRRDGFRECVYAAFKCSSLWCVHSRSMYALVGRGGPSKNLDFVISSILHRHEPPALETPGLPLAPMPRGKKAVFDVALHVRTRTLKIEKAIRSDTKRYTESECEDPEDEEQQTNKFLRKCLWDCVGTILETLRANLQSSLSGSTRGLTILLATDDEDLRPQFVQKLERHGTVFFSKGSILHTSKAGGSLIMRLPTMAEFFLMAKSHTLIEAGSYISTFAYFSGLAGNGTLAAIKMKDGGCRLRLEHTAELS